MGENSQCRVGEQENKFHASRKEVVDREHLNGNKHIEQSIDAIGSCRRHLSDNKTTLEKIFKRDHLSRSTYSDIGKRRSDSRGKDPWLLF
jgi:hypothetical protein